MHVFSKAIRKSSYLYKSLVKYKKKNDQFI